MWQDLQNPAGAVVVWAVFGGGILQRIAARHGKLHRPALAGNPTNGHGRIETHCGHIAVHAQAKLLEMVRTGDAPCRLARRLHSRQQHSDKNASDGNHDDELNQSKRVLFMPRHGLFMD